jgi:hypothetical protein
MFDIAALGILIGAAVSGSLPLRTRLVVLILIQQLLFVIVVGLAVHLFNVTANDKAVVEIVALMSPNGLGEFFVRLVVTSPWLGPG